MVYSRRADAELPRHRLGGRSALALLPEAGRVPNPSPELPSEPAPEILESLRALGYLEAEESDPSKTNGKE